MIEALKIIAESAQSHLGWSIALIGGSLAAIIGTSHHSPHNARGRCIYLLLVPAWVCLGLSIYFGDRAFRNYLAAALAPENANFLLEAGGAMNSDYYAQQWTLLAGVALLVTWLALYLIWWIFYRKIEDG